MWSLIASGVSALFGGGVNKSGSDKVMKAAEGVGNWVDNLQYTDQEKAQTNDKLIGIYAEYLQNTVNENSDRSITRRSLALWIIRTEVILLFISIALYKIDTAYSEYVYKVAVGEPMNYLVLGVGAFFFGAHLVRATKHGG